VAIEITSETTDYSVNTEPGTWNFEVPAIPANNICLLVVASDNSGAGERIFINSPAGVVKIGESGDSANDVHTAFFITPHSGTHTLTNGSTTNNRLTVAIAMLSGADDLDPFGTPVATEGGSSGTTLTINGATGARTGRQIMVGAQDGADGNAQFDADANWDKRAVVASPVPASSFGHSMNWQMSVATLSPGASFTGLLRGTVSDGMSGLSVMLYEGAAAGPSFTKDGVAGANIGTLDDVPAANIATADGVPA
jgi:hypothetical protein